MEKSKVFTDENGKKFVMNAGKLVEYHEFVAPQRSSCAQPAPTSSCSNPSLAPVRPALIEDSVLRKRRFSENISGGEGGSDRHRRRTKSTSEIRSNMVNEEPDEDHESGEEEDEDSEDEEEDDVATPTSSKKKAERKSWLVPEVERFLDICYEKHVPAKKDRKMGQNLTHAQIFKEVATALKLAGVSRIEKDHEACKLKYNRVAKKYRALMRHNSKSGNEKKTMLYFDHMHRLLQRRPCLTSKDYGFENQAPVTDEGSNDLLEDPSNKGGNQSQSGSTSVLPPKVPRKYRSGSKQSPLVTSVTEWMEREERRAAAEAERDRQLRKEEQEREANMMTTLMTGMSQVVGNMMQTMMTAMQQTVGQQPMQAMAQQPMQAMAQQPMQAMAQQPMQAMAQQPMQAMAQQPMQAMAQQPMQAMAQQPMQVMAQPAQPVQRTAPLKATPAPMQVHIVRAARPQAALRAPQVKLGGHAHAPRFQIAANPRFPGARPVRPVPLQEVRVQASAVRMPVSTVANRPQQAAKSVPSVAQIRKP